MPDSADVSVADAALERVRTYLVQHPDGPKRVRLSVEDDGAELVVPRTVVELLAQILAHMAAGIGVSIVPSHAELTTQQAADLLNVSRPYLIGLLEAGDIGYRRVGKHRRVQMSSLLDYLRNDDLRQREAADELTALNQSMGLI
ncbi:helix-turn-helix domain-containing protein [Frankia sp. Cj5]|uniref:helix-turn-helix domain-containing protein n=1 Tax=Frankia sp. Cj5 TaxID=2880978 RepID=UPI001EF598D3|nr:helix-turn-helix domain-containing protein [Frankia sp. Cj5]